MEAIRTDGLSKTYGSVAWMRRGPPPAPALDSVTIEVRTGEIFGFLGPNGSGKTTLIRLLLGYLRPSGGRATVLGLDAASESTAVRGRVGYLPGGIALYDGMTGGALLDYLARLYGSPAPLRADLCRRLGLDDHDLGRPVRDYSRGMRQKLGIVQALQHDPELAILDEPSEGLDPLVQQTFYAILAAFRDRGRTVFFSSHILSEVERVCDRVAIVRRGRLVALEDVPGLLARRTRQVELRFEGPPPSLGTVSGVSDVRIDGGRATCRLAGDVRGFLRALEHVTVTDLTIEPASLEEAFLEFYAEDLAGDTGAMVGRDEAG